MAWCPKWIGIGNEAIQKEELWANVVISEARSGADLIIPRQGAGVVQSARGWIFFDDFDVERRRRGGVWLNGVGKIEKGE